MDSRLIFRHCGGNVITKRGRRRLAESARKGNAEPKEDPAGKSTGSVQSHSEGVPRGYGPVKSATSRCPEKPLRSFRRNRTPNRHR
jgi:hypothetical protein